MLPGWRGGRLVPLPVPVIFAVSQLGTPFASTIVTNSRAMYLSGRYKAQLVEGSGNGYLRTACDYVHLNPVRARLLKPEDRLSFPYYLASPAHRPKWVRVDRLLGEHGLQGDSAATREQFERQME